jgi:hypothetical protein
LRAAELAPFGMQGIGRIYNDYVTGRVEDDDEVAVVHGPAEANYAVLSEAMVNIRYTLRKAMMENIISASTEVRLVNIAKTAAYPLRSYELLHQEGLRLGLPLRELESLRIWLPHGRVNQKEKDARLMLRAIKRSLTEVPAPPVAFTFQHTIAWDILVRTAGTGGSHEDYCPVPAELLLEELYLQNDELSRTKAAASWRYLAHKEALQRGWQIDERELREGEVEFRRARDLLDEDAFARWMDRNFLSIHQFRSLVTRELMILLTTRHLQIAPAMSQYIADYLRSSDAFAPLALRAAQKDRVLKALRLQDPRLEDGDLPLESLVQWYVNRTASNCDTGLALLGFAQEDAAGFLRAALREYLYVSHTEAARPALPQAYSQ